MKLERVGLGYRWDIVSEGVRILADRITESRGDMSAEVTVQRSPEGNVMRGRVNLSSMTARKSTASYCRERAPNTDWQDLLERFAVAVIDHEREGSPIEKVGNRPLRGKPSWLLDPMLVEGTATILYGEGGIGKSTMTAAIAVSVATGQPLLEGWAVPKARKVLVLDWESDSDDWNDLFQLLRAGMAADDPDILYMSCAGALPGMLHRLSAVVSEQDIGLVVVDSVGLATPSSREGSDANESALRLFSALRTLGVTSLLIDHVSKAQVANETSVQGPYGSVYKTNSARSVYELRQASADDDASRTVVLHHRKANRTARQQPVGIRITRDDVHIHLERTELPHVSQFGRSSDREGRPLTGSQRLWEALDADVLKSRQQLSEETGIATKMVGVYLNRELKDRVRSVGQAGDERLWGRV